MTRKLPPPPNVLTNCTVINSSPANEHTRAAVIALAKAAKANAKAIGIIAVALKGSNSHMEAGFKIGASE